MLPDDQALVNELAHMFKVKPEDVHITYTVSVEVDNIQGTMYGVNRTLLSYLRQLQARIPKISIRYGSVYPDDAYEFGHLDETLARDNIVASYSLSNRIHPKRRERFSKDRT